MAPIFAPTQPPNPITGNQFQGNQGGPAFASGPQGCFGKQVVDITLTSAQILLLQTTPVVLIPAPGVGFWLNVETIIMRLIGGSVAYTDVGGAVSFGAGTLTMALSANAIFLVTVSPNTRKQIVMFPAAAVGAGVLDTAANPPTDDNAAFQISKITNQFAAGNGTMHITVYFTTEPTL